MQAQRDEIVASTGPYARVRHPQYDGFILIMIGFLLQWPTFATLLMFPILLLVYRRLAIREEREVWTQLGVAWDRYAAVTPRFWPKLNGWRDTSDPHTAGRASPGAPAMASGPGRTRSAPTAKHP